ncbi:hypothetical protein LSH36_329g01020 [Paralvinella palmiformis]|uniref:Uncharacterized protein n=1 Tax=Paralvinella palmiformis TaxID=53620 RepID=A0AAD9JGV0_9ANNE|nr:hypothetical protein LSH36_329g01020 [Paralvinella palmiformis]
MWRSLLTNFVLFIAIQKVVCNSEDENITQVLCPGGCVDGSFYSFSCPHASCDQFPTELIANPDIAIVDVSFNKISSLPKLSYPHLISLDLSNNAITDVKEGTFDSCRDLKYLNLSMNVLTSITKQMFGIDLHDLEELDLSHNRIATIGEFSFQFLPALKSMNISYNNLERIENSVFFSSRVEILHLEANSLSVVGTYYFHDLTDLQYLSLRNNQIRSIEPDSFMLLDALERLDLGGNCLEDLRNDIFHEGVRRPFSNLQAIHLENNRLKTVHDNTFSPFPKLMYIFLDENQLTDISSIKPFPAALAEISLRGNAALKKITNGTFTGLKRLQRVNISGCYRLATIEVGAFDQEASSVTEFDVSECSLINLPRRLLNWTRTSVLRMSDNRWDCDCNLNWTKTTLPDAVLKTMQCTRRRSSNVDSLSLASFSPLQQSIPGHNTFQWETPTGAVLLFGAGCMVVTDEESVLTGCITRRCSTPHQLKGQTLLDVDIRDMSCDFYTRYGYSISVSLIIAATVVFVSGVTLLACRYRDVLFDPCSRRSRDPYKTVYHKAPEEEDYSDPAVSIQIDEANSETKLLKNAEPTQV